MFPFIGLPVTWLQGEVVEPPPSPPPPPPPPPPPSAPPPSSPPPIVVTIPTEIRRQREPLYISLYLGTQDSDLWILYGSYYLSQAAVTVAETLIKDWRVKVVYTYANGVNEVRIIEGYGGSTIIAPSPPPIDVPNPPPSSPPPSSPPPSAPPPGVPPPATTTASLDFSDDTNSMYVPLL